MNNLSEHIKIRLKVYSELINKSEDEALFFALGIAKAVHEKKIKLSPIPEPIADTTKKSRYTIAMEIRQDRANERARDYYQIHKEKIKLKRKRLKELKKINQLRKVS